MVFWPLPILFFLTFEERQLNLNVVILLTLT